MITKLISKCREFGVWLDKPWLTLQVGLFGIFVADGFRSTFVNIADGQGTLREYLDFLLRRTGEWFLLAFISTVVWIILKVFFNADLWLYYDIWMTKIPAQFHSDKEEYRLILASREYQDEELIDREPHKPCFIRRKHLSRRKYWPDWVYSIVTIRNPHKIKVQREVRHSQEKWVLEVDLRDESCGIYNNIGKRFLVKQYGAAARSEEVVQKSLEFHNFLQPSSSSTTPKDTYMSWEDNPVKIPLRWASGGFLPLVRYAQREWALVFFRDIPPIGLNLAIGASETKKEYKDLQYLIGREFSEEVILLSKCPHVPKEIPDENDRQPFQDIFTEAFSTDAIDMDAKAPIAKYLNEKFAEKHAEIRRQHDYIQLTPKKTGRPIHRVDTPFTVRVQYHTPDLKSSAYTEIPNVIYSLNPAEFGIEVIWLCSFPLREGEYLIDGEYDLSREYLIRQPVILLDMEYLKQIFEQEKSLGSLLQLAEQFECKQLPSIPSQYCKVFDIDVKLRIRRGLEIEKALKASDLTQSKAADLRYEKEKRIDPWLENYKAAFEESHSNGLQHPHLRTLCPVTWKTLELIFAHNINYKVGSDIK